MECWAKLRSKFELKQNQSKREIKEIHIVVNTMFVIFPIWALSIQGGGGIIITVWGFGEEVSGGI